MWTLSGFADEISPDFSEQLRVLDELGISWIELRSAWDTNVLDLSEDQLAEVQRLLAQHRIRVSSIGSPLGKIRIDEDFAPHLERARHALEVAERLDAPFIRLFSFFIPAGEDPASHREEVLHRMAEFARITAEHNAAHPHPDREQAVTLLHENEKEIYGDTPERCRDIVTSVDSPALRLAWDPANFVQVGAAPFDDGYAMLRPYVVYMQIKDALAADGSVVTAGRGDGQLGQTLDALKADGFDGFFSLEPHLGDVHHLGGFSGPEHFAEAHRDFTAMLTERGIAVA